jgi:hypothetical protein
MVTSVRPSLGLKRSNGGRFKAHNKSEDSPSTGSSILSYFSPLSLGRTSSAKKHTQPAQETASRSVNQPGAYSSPSASSSAEIVEREQPLPHPPLIPAQQPPRTKQPTTNGTRLRLTVRDPNLPSGASTLKSHNATPQPSGNMPSSSKETRTLRSKDGGLRLKSDLSLYFANYGDILVNGLDQKPEVLRVDEPIYILDEKISTSGPAKLKQRTATSQPPIPLTQPAIPPSPHSNVNNAKTIALTSIPSSSSNPADDPLSDSLYLKCHGRSERKEKQARNIEKERAQHEKENLERLLEGLQGPDWLRVMGVTGITEGEQKNWRPKRDYFIAEVSALVDRFRTWKDEEKRMRLEKERAREEEDDKDEEDDEEEGEGKEGDNASIASSDITASASRQLQIEAGLNPRSRAKRKKTPAAPNREVRPPPLTSFYKAAHLRAQAMGETRTTRHSTAFGQPIPDFDERDFELPEDYITPEALRANARKRRRMNRELKDAVSGDV